MTDATFPLLPHLPAAAIRACYDAAPGNEVSSGKFASPESSSALAANAFGFFLDAPEALPALPGCATAGFPARRVTLESILRFPWSGGRHPCLDVLIETSTAIVGVESKRYEPYRPRGDPDLSDAYWRPVWGEAMAGYCAVRDLLRDDASAFGRLDAAQLVKHAFGLRTAAHRESPPRSAILFYVFAEPARWSDGRSVQQAAKDQHRAEIERFAAMVDGDEVTFRACAYADLIAQWRGAPATSAHALAVEQAFDT